MIRKKRNLKTDLGYKSLITFKKYYLYNVKNKLLDILGKLIPSVILIALTPLSLVYAGLKKVFGLIRKIVP